MKLRKGVFICLSAALLVGCGGKEDAPQPAVAATTSYLECAAREFLGPREPILRLAGPGMCPGHFDIRPGQITSLRGCRLLLRFDFQESLEAKLTNLTDEGLRIASVKITGGLCEPDSYLSACRRASEALIAAGLLDRPAAEARLADVAARMTSLAEGAKRRIEAANLQGAPVLASEHQAAFCRRLGLNVVATFVGSDTARVGDIDAAIRSARSAGVKIVVANLPAGRRLADALAERLGAKVAVFGNFPTGGHGGAFDELVRDNVAELIAASR